jgi:hypothetical protein
VSAPWCQRPGGDLFPYVVWQALQVCSVLYALNLSGTEGQCSTISYSVVGQSNLLDM